MNLISPVTAPVSATGGALNPMTLPPGASDPNAISPTFGQTLQNAVADVNTLQNHAAALSRAYAAGQTSDIHRVMIVTEQATVALQMATQIRNKAVEAYQEVMRTTV